MDDWRTRPCFYVSVVDADRIGLLAGPFPVQETALGLVDRCNKLACDQDDKAWFYAYGTVRMIDGSWKGKFNDEIGYDAIIVAWVEGEARHQAWMANELEKQKEAGCSKPS